MRRSKKQFNTGFGLNPLPKDENDFQLGRVVPQMELSEISERFELPRLTPKHQADSDFCSAYGTTYMSEYQEGVALEPAWSFAVSKSLSGDPDEWGQNLRDAFKAHVKHGALPVSESPFNLGNRDVKFLRHLANWPTDLFEKAKPYKKASYFFIDGRYDHFDNICIALYQFRDAKRAVGTGVLWDWSLGEAQIPNEVPKKGFGHFVTLTGYDRAKDVLVLLNSYGAGVGDGGYFYIPRNVVNAFVERFGAGMFVDISPETVKLILKTKGTFMSEVRSRFFTLNVQDLAKGALVAVISAVLVYLQSVVNEKGLAITMDDLRLMASIAFTAGLGYLTKNLFENEKGENAIVERVKGLIKR